MRKSLQKAYERAIMHRNQVEAGRRSMEDGDEDEDEDDDDDNISENGFE